MTGLDTNVLVRYLVQDDPRQSALATDLIETLSDDAPGYISQVVLVELAWVLERAYKQQKPAIVRVLRALLHTSAIQVENTKLALQALRRFEAGSAGFADCLVERSGHEAGCARTVTFDTGAARDAGMELLGNSSI